MKFFLRFFPFIILAFAMNWNLFAQGESTPWSQTVTVGDQDTFQAYLDPANLKIVPTDKKEIRIQVSGIPKEDFSRIKLETKGTTVHLDFRGDKSGIPASFQLEVPPTFHLDLYVSGDVSSAAGLGGNLKIASDTGDIDLSDINGSITANTGSGEIYVKNVQGNATLTAKDGDIDVETVGGDLDLNNEEGDSYAKQVSGNLTARSTDGDVTIGDSTGNATINTEVGDVTIHKASGLTTINTTEGDVDLNEADNSLVIASTVGDITLKKISGPFEIKTDKGEVSAGVIPGRTGKGKITSQEGDLELDVPENSGVTIYANVLHPDSDTESSDDAIGSDFKPAHSDTKGKEVRNEYVLNGGGDTILVETSTGSIEIRKLTITD